MNKHFFNKFFTIILSLILCMCLNITAFAAPTQSTTKAATQSTKAATQTTKAATQSTKAATQTTKAATQSTKATTQTTTATTQATTQTATATTQDSATKTANVSDSNPSDKWPQAPNVMSPSAILIDADTGAILYEKEAHMQMYPASTTKILTALLAIENSSLSDIITFSKAAANSYKWDEANIVTKEGEQMTMEQALYATLLKSANEVAYGIGEYIGGSISNFADMMNKKAKELGAINSHFNNPNGLSDNNHYTTAYDMAMIARACFDNATFLNIDNHIGNYVIPPTNKTTTQRSFSQRHGMSKGNGYQYEYFKGGKTGFTDEAGYTLVTFAQKDDMRLICVIMKGPDDATRYVDTKSLFEYGFSNFNKVSISSNDVSSLFNSSNYYNSKVYGNSDIVFTMNASFVDLPNGVNFSDTTITINPDEISSNPAYDYTANIVFDYNSHQVGSAKLLVAASNTSIKSSNLPFIQEDSSKTPKAKKCLVINLWWIYGGCALFFIITEIYDEIQANKAFNQRKRRRGKVRRGARPRR